MSDSYTIQVILPDGDPKGWKIFEQMNWSGTGIAFPRPAWEKIKTRTEFSNSGVYVLIGPDEKEEELPTVYIGQTEKLNDRISTHYRKKPFWEWGYVFVSQKNVLNKGHTTWLEHQLLQKATSANRCSLNNENQPTKEPNLAEYEKSDLETFLNNILGIFLILNINVFEKPQAISVTEAPVGSVEPDIERMDTIVVPARADGFNDVFLQQDCWYAIRIGGGRLNHLRYIAAYQSAPVSAVTHYAQIKHIEPYGDSGKYKVVFSDSAKVISPIHIADARTGLMQSARYTTFEKLMSATKVTDLF